MDRSLQQPLHIAYSSFYYFLRSFKGVEFISRNSQKVIVIFSAVEIICIKLALQ